VALREAVALYHDRVRELVRQGHKLRARCRQHGLRPPGRVLLKQASWQEWLAAAPSREVRTGLEILWLGFETAVRQVELARQEQSRLSRTAGIVTLWRQWPGVGASGRTTPAPAASADTAAPAAHQRKNHYHGQNPEHYAHTPPVAFLPVAGQNHADQAYPAEAGPQI
jgi:hypothetical protein